MITSFLLAGLDTRARVVVLLLLALAALEVATDVAAQDRDDRDHQRRQRNKQPGIPGKYLYHFLNLCRPPVVALI